MRLSRAAAATCAVRLRWECALDSHPRRCVACSASRQAVFLSVEALWNMLEHSKEDLAQGEICISLSALLKKHRAANAAFLLGNEQSVVTITSIFERLLLFGFKKADKELRNEVLVVATLVAERKASVPLFVNSGFLGLVLEYAVAAEMELPVDANPRNFATSDPVDLEFKQLAWSLIGAMAAADDATMRRVQESLFVQTLLLYLDPSRAHGNRYLQIWAPTQRRALDLLAARLLLRLAPSCADQFNQYNGVVVALNHVRAHSSVLATPSGDSDAEGDGATELGDDESMDAPLITDMEDDVDRQCVAAVVSATSVRQLGVLTFVPAVAPRPCASCRLSLQVRRAVPASSDVHDRRNPDVVGRVGRRGGPVDAAQRH